MTSRQVVDSIDDVKDFVSRLWAQGKTGLVMMLENGTFEIVWCEAKHYTSDDNKELIDQVWFDKEGNLVAVQDMPLAQLRELARIAIDYMQTSPPGASGDTSAHVNMDTPPGTFAVPGNNTIH